MTDDEFKALFEDVINRAREMRNLRRSFDRACVKRYGVHYADDVGWFDAMVAIIDGEEVEGFDFGLFDSVMKKQGEIGDGK